MRTLTAISMGLALIAFGACATQQENPNYEYSTTYKGSNPTTYAANQTTVQTQAPAPIVSTQAGYQEEYADTQPIYTRLHPDCISGAAPRALCEPQEITTAQAAPMISEPLAGAVLGAGAAPTDMAYDREMNGTPGYMAIQDNQMDTSQTAPALAMPVPVPSQPTYATTPMDVTLTPSSLGAGQAHIVRQGDTVYSLARQLCGSIGEIQQLNQLDGNYKINIGDTIRLPASRC